MPRRDTTASAVAALTKSFAPVSGVLVRFGGRGCSIIVVGIQLSTESTALNIYRVFGRSCIAIIHPAVYT